ncbi:SARP family transcriptional regulator [Paractinoplanes deccanensis]|uniref:SARP family transcriptional regulator n=1 Tax=Paractinoplanes deccanensis TaxID=113561 RepID=A0ABQ3Y3Y6_9ACTN|nr:BTAD domain-containing putative transcriptional regulator [Actinoplanes deccanensis]GID74701.1 SARP family transcriptional regulator [Actinoplanes deccanensis]
MIEVRVLGPVTILLDGEPVTVRGNQALAVLAMLAAAHGRPVAADRLIDRLWGAAPPAGAAAVLQSHVSRLRRSLEPHRPPRGAAELLVSEAPGYALRLPAGALDAGRFEQGVRAADGLPPAGALDRLRAALELWRGRPYEQFADHEWAAAEVARLTELHHTARERVVAALLRLDRADEAIPAARALTADDPLRGEPWRLLALALWAASRSGDALAALGEHRRVVADELGLDPDPALAALEQAIREQRAEVLEAAVRPAPSPIRPAQLPRAAPVFAGRASELRRLDRHTPALVVISGTGGVGKTTLALRWAHRAAERYPDGQLHVDLRGFGPEDAAADPGDVLAAFLGALGVPDQRIPPSTPERTALFRSVLAARRMLVVLDNARDSDQVRPLLPGNPGCAVVVTSRSHLIDLVVTDGAHPLRLDAFRPAESVAYLRRRLGDEVVDADPRARDAIVERCGGLPLALALVCARGAFPLAEIDAELAYADGLDGFAVAGVKHDLRAVFSWSYRRLEPLAARMFRLIALHPGPDLSIAAAAALAGTEVAVARALLRRLADDHLLAEHRPGRFVLHDLVRAYARETAGRVDPAEDRAAAVTRLLDFALHSAGNAARAQHPFRRPVMVGDAPPGVGPVRFADAAAAIGWLDLEYDNITALLELCRAERPGHLPGFVWALAPYQQDVRFHLADSLALATDALAATDDRRWTSYLHHVVGRGLLRLNRLAWDHAYRPGGLDEARRLFEEHIEINKRWHNAYGAAGGWMELARFHQRAGDRTAAARAREQALRVLGTARSDRPS